MSFKDFKTHKPSDSSDPGFSIPGYRLHWVSGRVSEYNADRPWAPIRKTNLPDALVQHITKIRPWAFDNGDCYRRGDLLLACSEEDAYQTHRTSVLKAAKDLEGTVRRTGARGNERISVEVDETRDATREMIERFKAKQN